MSIPVVDRLGVIDDARGGLALQGRFLVRSGTSGGMFINSFAAQDGMFVVPDSGGRWCLLGAPERAEGIFPRAQMLDPLDIASICTVGRSLADVVDRGGSWLDALDISPLVPGMSDRADFQRFEQLVKDNIGHLEEVCRRPRTHLRVDVERMAVSRARRFPAQAANYLAAHTEDWERPTLRSVIPKRILATVREDQFDIYENRVAVRLVDHLVEYLRRRVHEVMRLLRVFDEAAGNHETAASGSYWRQARIYRLWGETIDASEAKRKAERTLAQLRHLLLTVSGLKDSLLYRAVPRRATVGTTLTMTNVLSDDAHYRRVAELWLEWARLGQELIIRPRAHFEQMQNLCRSFDGFALLLTLRALDQLGFTPTEPQRRLSDGEARVRHGSRTARLSRSSGEGWLALEGDGIEPLRVIPLCSSIAMLDAEPLRCLIAEADTQATKGVTTVVLYPSPADAKAFEHLPSDVAVRLLSLAHEVGTSVTRRVGFLPVSPWDIGSVERVARQLRWVIAAPMLLKYPPALDRPDLKELNSPRSWFDFAGRQIRILRAPAEHEDLPVSQFVNEAGARLKKLEDERESVALQLREAIRDRGVTGAVNARKKELNAEITAATRALDGLRRFETELAGAVAIVEDLLVCPTCTTKADTRRHFIAMGEYFSCTCPDCMTTWGTIACGRCSGTIPVIRLNGTAWAAKAGDLGWVDRTLGADVLAVPRVTESEVVFACQSCGHVPGKSTLETS